MDPRFPLATVINELYHRCDAFQAAVQTIESVGMGIGNAAASFNPLNAIATVLTGQEASGEEAGTGGRILAGVNVVFAALGPVANVAKEGIYEFAAASAKPYVGQSGQIAERIARHLASGKLLEADLASLRTTEILGGKTAREIAE